MKRIAMATALLLTAFPATADEEQPQRFWGRYEFWTGVSSWPSLDALQPAAPGSFDALGWGMGGAIHVSVRQFANSDLLVGVDGFIMATDSNISGFVDDLLARQLYLGASLKWAFGEARNVHLDTGLGYYLADMAEVSTRYYGLERVVWDADRLGAFVGATWDIGAGREGRQSGLSLALRAHFVDYGTVRDDEVLFTPLIGEGAGKLDGPFYVLQIGYSSR